MIRKITEGQIRTGQYLSPAVTSTAARREYGLGIRIVIDRVFGMLLPALAIGLRIITDIGGIVFPRPILIARLEIGHIADEQGIQDGKGGILLLAILIL